MLQRLFGYNIHPDAKIGLAWIYPEKLTMEEGARIDHFTIAIHLAEITMGAHSYIGRGNWITGFPLQKDSRHFSHQIDRKPELKIEKHSAITKNHHIDCTDSIQIGSYVTIAGYHSQLLTHSIDIYSCRQDSAPIRIGDYCFIGTNVTILGGANLPACSVLGAKSLLNKNFEETHTLYAGVPAKPKGEFPKNTAYFNRKDGFIY